MGWVIKGVDLFICDGAVGAVVVLSCEVSFVLSFIDSFLLFESLFSASRNIWLIDVKIMPEKPANNILATLACRFNCVWGEHVIEILLSSKKKIPLKINIEYNIANLSKL